MGLRSENLQLSTHMISYAITKMKEFETDNRIYVFKKKKQKL